MGIFFKGMPQLKNKDWSKGWLWDVMFEAGPSGFNGWFPATELEVNEFSLEPYNFAGGNSTFEIPKSTSLFDIKVTYVDDIRLHIEEWVNYWVNVEILGNGNTATIEESVKKISIAKHMNKNRLVHGYPKNYWVFPKGALYYKGVSEASNISDTLEFVIAGDA